MMIIEFVFGVILVGLVVVGIVIALITRVLGGGSAPPRQAGKEEQMQEARMIQEMYRGLSRLEQRVDTLETLLLDRASKRERDKDGTP